MSGFQAHKNIFASILLVAFAAIVMKEKGKRGGLAASFTDGLDRTFQF